MSEPTEEAGTFRCPVCGAATPHYHDTDEVNRARVVERLVRPMFEAMWRKEFDDDAASLFAQTGQRLWKREIVTRIVDRGRGWNNPLARSDQSTYDDLLVEAAWQFWRMAWDAAPTGQSEGEPLVEVVRLRNIVKGNQAQLQVLADTVIGERAAVARLTGELAELKAARDSDKPAWHRMQDALHGWSHRATDAEAEVSRLSARVAELEQNLKQSIERPWVGPLSDE